MTTTPTQAWLDESLANMRHMATDEAYRQEVASRATLSASAIDISALKAQEIAKLEDSKAEVAATLAKGGIPF